MGDKVLIGIGALVLDDAEIGSRSVVAPGAVVPPGVVIPDGVVVMGVPGRIVRQVGPEDQAHHPVP